MLWNQPDDSGFEESSEKLSEPRNSETWIENLSDDIDLQGEYETPEKRLEVEKKYGFAIKEGANILATLPDEEGALEKSSETTSDDDSPSKNWALKGVTSVVKANAPTENVFNVYDSKDFHCGDVVNVTKKVVVEIINPQPSEKDDQESIETGRKKLSTTIKGVAAGVLSILVLVIIIVIVEITQLQNSGGGEKPTYDEAWEGNVTLVTRDQWNARVPDPPTEVYAASPRMVVIIHTAGRTCPSVSISCKDIVRMIQSEHMALGWRDVGYNFLVAGDGQVYAGTSWNHRGKHSLDKNNEKSIAIAFIGNFNKAVPTREQLDAARTVVEVGFKLGKLDPNASVVLHSQIRPFSSPGTNVENVIKQEWPWWSPLGDKDIEKPLNFAEIFFNRSQWFAANPKRPFQKNNTFPLRNVRYYLKESNNQTNSFKTVIELQRSYINDGGDDLPSNFVITSDGCIFEGRGWNYAGARNSQDIEIQILVTVMKRLLETKIRKSVQLLMDAGIDEGKLPFDYKPATPKDDTYDTEDHSGPGNVSWVSRKTCGLQNPTKYVNVTSLPLPSDSIIVSHTVTPECSSQETCCSRVASVQARMMTWSYDIGYHFLVGSDGNIYEGRQWDQEGAHTKGANCKLGVAFIGNFMDKTPIEKQVDASFKLFDGLVLANLLTPNYTIFGQNDVGSNPTESPGKVLIELMKNWPHYRKEDQIVRGPCYKKNYGKLKISVM